uniref:Uncharacterized protein n=1 Tax=Anopheles merus TaxID=30066 RepID=A0A182V1X1_ANOME
MDPTPTLTDHRLYLDGTHDEIIERYRTAARPIPMHQRVQDAIVQMVAGRVECLAELERAQPTGTLRIVQLEHGLPLGNVRQQLLELFEAHGWFGTIWLSKLAGPEGCVPPPPPPSPSPPRTPLQHMFSSMLSRSSMPPPGPAGPASAFCCDAYVCRFSPFREDVLAGKRRRRTLTITEGMIENALQLDPVHFTVRSGNVQKQTLHGLPLRRRLDVAGHIGRNLQAKESEVLVSVHQHPHMCLPLTRSSRSPTPTLSSFSIMLLAVSENTRMMNSPSSFGSNVDGTITYVPGGSLNRQLTSRRLMNAGDRAADALYLKKFIFSGFCARSRSVTRYTANPIVRHSTPMLRRERRFFCSSAMITVQLPSSSSSSGSSSRITYCGLCQNVSR